MISVHEAKQIILGSITPLPPEEIPIIEATNRILYEDLTSDIMMPPVDDSAMDGYAVTADDTRGASESHPVQLQVTGEVQAGGSTAGKKVTRGTAIRIMTGAAIPEGADSVVKSEDTEEEWGYVKIFREADKYENYRFAGENIRKGEIVLERGDKLNPADIGLLASLNRNAVRVYRQPVVSIISTGDEIADVGEQARKGQITNINAYTLYSEVARCKALPRYLGIVKDSTEKIKQMFSRALESDVVVSTGGVSAGRYDFVKEIFSQLDIEIQFERVNVKPGSPCVFGKKEGKLVFGLPGNPVPVLTSFIQFVRPALLRLMGATRVEKPLVSAILEKDINSGKAYHLARGYFTIRDGQFYVTPTGNQKPSMLRSMSEANCLIVIPENIAKGVAGQTVEIQLIEHDEL
jgi:molybdopterin molybdotransferase